MSFFFIFFFFFFFFPFDRCFSVLIYLLCQIIVSVFLPRLREHEFVQAYKQARRRDDDIAIVNACFRVHLVHSAQGVPTVAEASFAFGGLGPVTLAARQTDAVILGRTWNEETLDAVVAALQLDFPLTADAPGGMPQYRQTLAASFFMKFFLTVKQQLGGAVPASQASATEKRHRPASQSTQLFEVVFLVKFIHFWCLFLIFFLHRHRWWARVATILWEHPWCTWPLKSKSRERRSTLTTFLSTTA